MARTVLIVVVVVVLLYVLMVGVLWGFQRRLVYLPSGPVPPAGQVLDGVREVTLTTADGIGLGAWFVPAHGDDQDVTVLVAAGNGGNRAVRAPLADALAREGLSVLLFDYRGYGENGGNPTEAGLARDVRAAYRYLTDDLGVPPRRLLYYGESLGAAVVTELAAEHPPAALLLRSPFTDLAAVARAHYPFLPVRALLWDRYPLIEHLAEVNVPTVVVYGTADTIVPPDQSRAVAAAAPGPTRAVPVAGADHNDRVLLDGPELVGAVVDLAGRIGTDRR